LVDKCKPGVDPRTHYQCDPLWARTSSANRLGCPGSSRELGRLRSPGNRLDSRWTNTSCPSCGGRLEWGEWVKRVNMVYIGVTENRGK
jgi:hypothetical protein